MLAAIPDAKHGKSPIVLCLLGVTLGDKKNEIYSF
jgi:hypothetical protein